MEVNEDESRAGSPTIRTFCSALQRRRERRFTEPLDPATLDRSRSAAHPRSEPCIG